ncbi:hypothetical protein KEJ25_03640 [Candidatus Bathyarchaeota archaeon]|nr:hypothetical protein [Candidatus Bathyarchaeota archaeon]
MRRIFDLDAGLAEFSAHAFTWTKQIYWKPKSPIDHSRGEEYSEDELKRFFEILDSLACKWGIKWSKVLTAHFGEVGKNALSFLIERGITYLAMPYAFGIPYGESPLELREEKMKRLKPFGGQGGVIDRHPDNSEFFIAAPSYWNIPKSMLQLLVDKGVITPQGQIYDFLWETARVKVDIELAAWYAAFGIKLCLDSLSFAVLVTHEQNISVLNSQEWDNLLTRVDKLTSKYEKIYKSWSYIAEYAQNLCNSKLTYVDYNVDTGEIQCQLKGKSSMPLYLHVFKDRYYWIERGFKEVPTYEGEITINFKPENLLFISSAVSK